MSETTHSQDPHSSLNKIRGEFENWLGMVVQQGEKALGAFGFNGNLSFQPDVDIVETAEAVCICLDIPGIDPDSIDLTIAGNILRVQGVRAGCAASQETGARTHLQERMTGSFDRSIPMPTQVLPDQISAEAHFGTLSVRLAKPEPERPQEIKIQVTSSSSDEAESVPAESTES